MRAQFLALISRQPNIHPEIPPVILDLLAKKNSDSNKKKFQQGLPQEYYRKWLQQFPNYTDSSGSSSPTSAGQICCFPSVELYKKRYSILKQHLGNSTVYFEHGGIHLIGQIELIFSAPAPQEHMFFVVSPFQELKNPLAKEKDPYTSFPHLNAALLYTKKSDPIILESIKILGHAVILINPPGTFGITEETCCAVKLNSVMSQIGNSEKMMGGTPAHRPHPSSFSHPSDHTSPQARTGTTGRKKLCYPPVPSCHHIDCFNPEAIKFICLLPRTSAKQQCLILVIKSVLKQCGMNEVYTGGLGSYSIICLVVSFLQLHPKIQRGDIDPNKNLGVLSLESFELYGISVLKGGFYFSKVH
ncbi:hypothetical protein PGTUg99_035295 [Puccinia graminis f. sp. tritici]|uniref:Polynucleotide adenylyltransferase n=1 Tax=Puccinia graminis f. sp. tritici TaxID=56615 RepID=A0A5B0Q997_PUCGR|nr:hypothetical protein PGTUg99_035295 [Puccinia graminis f. sp. tritici]